MIVGPDLAGRGVSRATTAAASPKAGAVARNTAWMPKLAMTALPRTGPPPLPTEFAIVSRPNAAPRQPERDPNHQQLPDRRDAGLERREDGRQQQAADQRRALAEPAVEATDQQRADR